MQWEDRDRDMATATASVEDTACTGTDIAVGRKGTGIGLENSFQGEEAGHHS
jgi:hypothetical protein